MKLHQQVVLRNVSKVLYPFIVVFGIYVIMLGELGPGGGFQGGVIIAAAFILYGLVGGMDQLRRVVPRRLSDACSALGVLIYAGVGVATLLLGGGFLDRRSELGLEVA